MTKTVKGMKDAEFESLVDQGFCEPAPERPRKHGGNQSAVWVPSDALRRDMEREGSHDGLTRDAARFNGAMGRCLGVKPGKLSEKTVKFLNDFSAKARMVAKAHGIELVDEE